MEIKAAHQQAITPINKNYRRVEDIVADFGDLLMSFDQSFSVDEGSPVYSGEDNGIKIHVSAPTGSPGSEGECISLLPVPLAQLPISCLCLIRGDYSAILTASYQPKPGTTDKELKP